MRKYKLSLPLPDITGVWIFSLGVWFHIVGRLVYRSPRMAFFLSELIAVILVLSGAYRVLDAWIARVSREEREALEARQAAILAAEKEDDGDEPHVSQ
ncbi:TPA: type-F conjugative transfer system pilin chaperone TraQ [Salmonella enterica subsp. enterica serovar Muenchen]|uniref:Type-F conjugative transfer system pilin chaperone TraQ n=1 Tax=Salmonella enterica I TaxID=59201 RepID=A0A403MNT7_SALET|nr:type-F conjugative transfer system pilin chaperone TraQ [Salmonella enterica]EAB6033243.1 type-F conjugative transfer system pilin chaperone TraQ [Salmonella enterica subsp. enterica serovar Java]EBI0041165.1 type-F conjugative transfer system pilin chaperone TraQ [Salmonella enterica subsp. diarizonae serovar 61:k:z35]EBW6040679.1 type-F conjugative transfer system pilin chaperone TraQ [Salmonella enterica subsp. enterica serovar Oranienburg]ECD9254300.1 type-F conjugative transfer system p